MRNDQIALLAAALFHGLVASGGYSQPTIDGVIDTATRFYDWLDEDEEEGTDE